MVRPRHIVGCLLLSRVGSLHHMSRDARLRLLAPSPVGPNEGVTRRLPTLTRPNFIISPPPTLSLCLLSLLPLEFPSLSPAFISFYMSLFHYHYHLIFPLLPCFLPTFLPLISLFFYFALSSPRLCILPRFSFAFSPSSTTYQFPSLPPLSTPSRI